MRIAVIGAGSVGGTLGRRWAALGHEVAFGVRRPERGAAAVKGGDALPPRTHVMRVADATYEADVVVLATPWSAVPDALAELGDLDGLPLIDTTNPLEAGRRLDTGPDGESAAERIQAMAPRARVVKAFNTTGANNMANPAYDGAATAMFVAGDDAVAKAVAMQLSTALGFETFDAGPLVRSRELEHLASLWIQLAYAGGLGRGFAFRLVRR